MSITAIDNQPINFVGTYGLGLCKCEEDDITHHEAGEPFRIQVNQEPCTDEELANPFFNDLGADWVGAGWTFDTGEACWDAESLTIQSLVEQSFAPTIGEFYQVRIVVTEIVGTLQVIFGGALFSTISSPGTYTYFVDASSAQALTLSPGGRSSGCVEEASVRIQTTDTVVDIIDEAGVVVDDFNYTDNPGAYRYEGNYLTLTIPTTGIDNGCYTIRITDTCGDQTIILNSNTVKVITKSACWLRVLVCNNQEVMGFSSTFKPSALVDASISRPTWTYDTSGDPDLRHYARREAQYVLAIDRLGETMHRFMSTLPLWQHVYFDDDRFDIVAEEYSPSYADTQAMVGGISMQVQRNAKFLTNVLCGAASDGCFPLDDENGSVDTGFTVTSNGAVFDIQLDASGNIYIVGSFTVINGVNRRRICRLYPDGSVDETFDPGTGFDNRATSIRIDGDGKLVVGGWFTEYNGIAMGRICRIETDGTLDATFSHLTGFSGIVNVVRIQGDGKIVAAGSFDQYDGATRNGMARLASNGDIDITFTTPSGGFNSGVQSIDIEGGGTFVAGGFFTSYAGTTRERIARINADGTLAGSLTSGANGAVHEVHVNADGKILVVGSFTQMGGQPRGGVGRYNADGTIDMTYATAGGANFGAFAIDIGAAAVAYVGGQAFTTYDGQAAINIARIDTDGDYDPTFVSVPGANGPIYSVTFQQGQLYVGGNFTQVAGINSSRIARINV